MSNEMDQDKVYQRIGEFVVSFQWLEDRLRQIGWLILDPSRSKWPPRELRDETTASLMRKVEKLFLDALPQCQLDPDLESDFRNSFAKAIRDFDIVRRARNKILHSAYIELKGGGEVLGLMRSNPKLLLDEETGGVKFDQEALSSSSFDAEMSLMAEIAMTLNRCYIQLIHRFPMPDGAGGA